MARRTAGPGPVAGDPPRNRAGSWIRVRERGRSREIRRVAKTTRRNRDSPSLSVAEELCAAAALQPSSLAARRRRSWPNTLAMMPASSRTGGGRAWMRLLNHRRRTAAEEGARSCGRSRADIAQKMMLKIEPALRTVDAHAACSATESEEDRAPGMPMSDQIEQSDEPRRRNIYGWSSRGDDIRLLPIGIIGGAGSRSCR